MAEDCYFCGSGFKIGVMLQTNGFYDPDPDAAETAPTWASGQKVASVDGWEFNVAFDLKKLYAMSSTKRIAVARSNARVEGKLEFAKFDPTVGTFWVMKIPNSAGGGTVADTSEMTFFLIYGSVQAFGTGPVLGAKVFNAAFSNLPFGANKNEWCAWNLSYTGTHVEVVNAEVTFT